MKATDFTRVLREIIRKEVRAVIREELKEAFANNRTRSSQILPSKAPTSAREMFLSKPTPQPRQPLNSMTGNASLDSILAETANDLRSGRSTPIQENQNGGWDTMGDYQAEDAQGFGMMQGGGDYNVTTNSNDPTAAFMKDYSSVLQSSYEHSGLK